MPRKGRIDAPGALHHVIIRGIERRKIFRSDYDRKNFISRLAVLVPATQIDCFAWAMLDNHVHFLLRTGLTPVSNFMSRLLTGYVGWFNRKYKRHGQLFQNRYKSILCFWAHRKLGMTTIEIARRLNISQPTASRSSIRGGQIEKENRFELIA